MVLLQHTTAYTQTCKSYLKRLYSIFFPSHKGLLYCDHLGTCKKGAPSSTKVAAVTQVKMFPQHHHCNSQGF